MVPLSASFGLGCEVSLPRNRAVCVHGAQCDTLQAIHLRRQPTNSEPRCIQASTGLWLRLGEAICDLGRFARGYVHLAFAGAIA
jgi:hypothetical protein